MGQRLALAGTLLLACGCHRSALFFGGDTDPPPIMVSADAAPALAADAGPDRPPPPPDLSLLLPDGPASPDLPAVIPPDAAAATMPPVTPGCTPQPETCNGKDDDCDGKIDEELAAIPCPNGGSRFCVAGRTSECPRICDQCRPGSRRVCFISYCTYWGTQSCGPDGRSFGLCRESPVPAECEAIARSKKKSPELERCCIDNGYCCLDEHDLDGDGNRTEMLGRCGAVTCEP